MSPTHGTLVRPVSGAGGRHTEDPAITFGAPERAEPLGGVHPVTPDGRRLVVRDVAEGEGRPEVVPRYGGA